MSFFKGHMPKCKLFGGGTVTKPAKRVSAARRRSKSVTVQSTSDLLHKMGLPSATDRANSQHRPSGFRRPGYMQPTKAASSKKFNRSVYILHQVFISRCRFNFVGLPSHVGFCSGAIQVLRNAVGGSAFPGKKHYEGIRFNVMMGWVGVKLPGKTL